MSRTASPARPAKASALQRVRRTAALFAVASGLPCLTLMDTQLPVLRLGLAYLAVVILTIQAVAVFLRGRVTWYGAFASGPLLALASLGLAEHSSATALGLTALAGQSLYGSVRQALVRSALVAGVIPVLVISTSLDDGPVRAVTNALVPVIVLALFSMLLWLLYTALTTQQAAAEREALLARTSRALLETPDVAAAESVVRGTLEHLAATVPGLELRTGPGDGPGRDRCDGSDERDQVVVPTSAGTLVLTGPALERAEIRDLIDTIASQLAMVLSNHAARCELYTMAHHDLLTSLCNRRAFFARLTEALDGAAAQLPLGLLLVDLDDFKAVNDTHGHAAGDAVLVEVSRRMRQVAGQSATVARFGGDEFAVLAPLVGPTELQLLAERLRDAVGRPISWGSREVQIGASIGIADDGAGSDPGDLMRLADLAMYGAKALGKNRVLSYAAAAPRSG